MTRVADTAQVLALVQAHLERLRRLRERGGVAAKSQKQRAGALQRARQLADAGGLSNADVAHVLISALLAEDFGEATLTDAKFQSLVGEVIGLIKSDPASKALLDRACDRLLAE